MGKISLAFFLFCSLCARAQFTFRIIFSGKEQCVESEAKTFLSDQALERRQKAGVSWDFRDCPVTARYLDTLALFPLTQKAISRWLNTVVYETEDTSLFPALRALPFVRQLDLISVSFQNEMRSFSWKDFPVLDQSLSGFSFYGSSYSAAYLHNGDLLHREGFTGQGMRIAVFDNGFPWIDQIPMFSHLQNQGRIISTYDFVKDTPDVSLSGSHGTYVLSCLAAYEPGKIVGSAPDADFMLFVTEDDASETLAEEYHWAEAAEWAEAQGADIFSTSLGYTTFDNGLMNHTYADMDGNTTPITQAANIAASKGVLVFNSAGNEGNKPWFYISAPADGSQVIAVGAVDSSGNIASFSGNGPNASGQVKPDICAQGVQNTVTDLGQHVIRLNGTSFSCPVISGLSACLWQSFPDSSSFSIREMLLRYAHRFSNPDTRYGYGIPNLYNALLQERSDLSLSALPGGVVKSPPTLVSSHIPLLFFQSKTQEYNLKLYDLSGRIVYRDRFLLRAGTFEDIQLDVSEVGARGMYILEVNGTERQIFRCILQ